jgi:hypothetical protein
VSIVDFGLRPYQRWNKETGFYGIVVEPDADRAVVMLSVSSNYSNTVYVRASTNYETKELGELKPGETKIYYVEYDISSRPNEMDVLVELFTDSNYNNKIGEKMISIPAKYIDSEPVFECDFDNDTDPYCGVGKSGRVTITRNGFSPPNALTFRTNGSPFGGDISLNISNGTYIVMFKARIASKYFRVIKIGKETPSGRIWYGVYDTRYLFQDKWVALYTVVPISGDSIVIAVEGSFSQSTVDILYLDDLRIYNWG